MVVFGGRAGDKDFNDVAVLTFAGTLVPPPAIALYVRFALNAAHARQLPGFHVKLAGPL